MKIDHNTRRIAEVVLVRIGKLVGESGQQIVDLRRPERDGLADRDVYTSTENHRERIFSRSLGERAIPDAWLAELLKGIGVDVAMRRPKEQMPKWM